MRLAICDDNEVELFRLTHFIDKYKVSRHIDCEYAVFNNGFDLISALEKGEQFDVYCLDILMPSFSGIDTAKEIRTIDKNAPIILLTSSPDFAVESYSVKAANYILKPVMIDVLFQSLDDILEQISQKSADVLLLKSVDGIQKVLISNIVYVEVIGRKVFYHLISGRLVECAESISAVYDTLLPYSSFIRPHRSYIVNMNYIDAIDTASITMQTKTVIPIAQGKAKEVRTAYLEYLRNQ